MKAKSEVWDEAAKTHYAAARKFTLFVLQFLILIMLFLVLGMKIFQKSIVITLNMGYFFIIYGLIELLLSGSFVYLEKRDANGI